MAVKKNPVSIQVTVTLNQASQEYLDKHAKDGDVSAVLSGWCSYWLDNQARGGILLEPNDHDYLAELNTDKKRFRDSRALVRAVERGLKRQDGQYSSVANIDPALITPLKDHAESMGQTVDETVTQGINLCLVNGWLYALEPDDSLRFTDKDMEVVKSFVGKKQVFGADLADALRGAAKKEAA